MLSLCVRPIRTGAVCCQDVLSIDSAQSSGRADNLQKEGNARERVREVESNARAIRSLGKADLQAVCL